VLDLISTDGRRRLSLRVRVEVGCLALSLKLRCDLICVKGLGPRGTSAAHWLKHTLILCNGVTLLVSASQLSRALQEL